MINNSSPGRLSGNENEQPEPHESLASEPGVMAATHKRTSQSMPTQTSMRRKG